MDINKLTEEPIVVDPEKEAEADAEFNEVLARGIAHKQAEVDKWASPGEPETPEERNIRVRENARRNTERMLQEGALHQRKPPINMK